MPYSYNGWYASPYLSIRPLVIAGEPFTPGVLDNPDVWTVFNYLANRLHNEVEQIVRPDWHQADDWGYSYRYTTNDTTLSCHSSGTAIDYNATRHPFGVSPYANFSQAQIDKIHAIIADLPIVWGGDYRSDSNKDAMHYEIAGSAATVAAAAARIRQGNVVKEWDEMATKEEFRAVIREEIRNTDWIKMLATKVATAVWGRTFKTVNANGAEVTKKASEYVKETWSNLKVHGQ